MKKIIENRWVWLTARVLLGAVFLAAAVTKIQDMSGFVDTVVGYHMLPEALARLYGWVVPWVELYAGVALILGVFTRFTALLTIPMTLSFVVASIYAIANATAGPCGCFGNFISLNHPTSLTIDVVMIIMALILLQKDKSFLAMRQLLNRVPFFNKTRLHYTASLVLALVVVMGIVPGIALGVKGADNKLSVIANYTIPSPLDENVGQYLDENKPVLFIVSAEGCGACEEAKPIIDAFETEFGNKVEFLRVDYWQYETQMKQMGVINTPTILLFTAKNQDGTFAAVLRQQTGIKQEEMRTALESVSK